MTTPMNAVQGAEFLAKEKAKIKPAAMPPASNPAPLDAWRKVIDAKPPGGAAAPIPFSDPHLRGGVPAIDAWRAAIVPKA